MYNPYINFAAVNHIKSVFKIQFYEHYQHKRQWQIYSPTYGLSKNLAISTISWIHFCQGSWFNKRWSVFWLYHNFVLNAVILNREILIKTDIHLSRNYKCTRKKSQFIWPWFTITASIYSECTMNYKIKCKFFLIWYTCLVKKDNNTICI